MENSIIGNLKSFLLKEYDAHVYYAEGSGFMLYWKLHH